MRIDEGVSERQIVVAAKLVVFPHIVAECPLVATEKIANRCEIGDVCVHVVRETPHHSIGQFGADTFASHAPLDALK